MTWNDLAEDFESRGYLVETTLGRWMDEIEEETGRWPSWDDPVPAEYLHLI